MAQHARFLTGHSRHQRGTTAAALLGCDEGDLAAGCQPAHAGVEALLEATREESSAHGAHGRTGPRGPTALPSPAPQAHLGCSLYTEPSTPTVMRMTSSLRLSRMRLMTPASPAAHMCAARVDTLSQARRTRSQSATDARNPRVRRMLRVCLRSPESLQEERRLVAWYVAYGGDLAPGGREEKQPRFSGPHCPCPHSAPQPRARVLIVEQDPSSRIEK